MGSTSPPGERVGVRGMHMLDYVGIGECAMLENPRSASPSP
ncbi:hypothetical protein [Azospirillum largimobile]